MSTEITNIKKKLFEKVNRTDKNTSQIRKVKKIALKDIPNIEQFFSSKEYDLTTDVNDAMRLPQDPYLYSLLFGKIETESTGQSPLGTAILNANLAIVHPDSPLARIDWQACIKLLIKYGAEINFYCLNFCCREKVPYLFHLLTLEHYGNPKTIDTLLQNGINLLVRDKKGFTALDWSIVNDSPLGKVKIENYESFFSIDINQIPKKPWMFQQNRLFRQLVTTKPVFAHWVQLLYKHYTDECTLLKNEFSKLVYLSPNITNIIALYETSYLIMDISLVLEENPGLFDKIKQSLCEMLKTSYIQYQKKDWKDSEVVEFISLIFSNQKSSKETKERNEILKLSQSQQKVNFF